MPILLILTHSFEILTTGTTPYITENGYNKLIDRLCIVKKKDMVDDFNLEIGKRHKRKFLILNKYSILVSIDRINKKDDDHIIMLCKLKQMW